MCLRHVYHMPTKWLPRRKLFLEAGNGWMMVSAWPDDDIGKITVTSNSEMAHAGKVGQPHLDP